MKKQKIQGRGESTPKREEEACLSGNGNLFAHNSAQDASYWKANLRRLIALRRTLATERKEGPGGNISQKKGDS